MRGAALLALLVAALGGCSSEPAAEHGDGATAGNTPAQAAPPAAGPKAKASTAVGAGSPLTGQVSGLNSSISGLNIRVTDTGTIIDLPADALFEFDSATLTPVATEQLGKSAQVIREAPAGTIRIVGHTDSKGDDAYNLKLSQRRAQAVADWFGGQVGVRRRSFEVSGMGELSPVAPNQTPDGQDDPAGRARNRRVEVIVPNRP